LRFEEVLAQLKMMFAQSKGAEHPDIYDYLPHFDKPELSAREAYEQFWKE